MKIRTNSDGFSLIEVAIGLLIIGIIMAPMLDEYAAYKNSLIVDTTKGNSSVIQDALQKYAVNTGWYPAPASPGVNSTNVNFGVQTPLALAALPACAGNDTVACKTPCTGANCIAKGSPPVLIGDVPFATLGLPKQYILDGWGRKYTYAISSNLTTLGGAANFDDSGGVVLVVDSASKGPTYTAGPPPASTGTGDSKAHYAVVSHGRDGIGAFTIDAVNVAICAGVGKDLDNCNNDGRFNNGYAPFYDPKGILQYNRQESNPAGANHFDDYVGYETSTASDIWTKVVNGAAIGNMKTRIDSNILIQLPTSPAGPTNPQARVDVRGNAEADRLWTQNLCDTSANSYNGGTGLYTNFRCKATTMTSTAVAGTNGFDPKILVQTPVKVQQSGKGIHCGTGNALSGIKLADEACATAANVRPPAGFTIGKCVNPGEYPYGISAGGVVLCSTSPHP